MRSSLYFGIFSSIFSICQAHDIQENEAILKRMVDGALHSAMEQYHTKDWMDIKETASKYWRDPTSPLEQEVTAKVFKFKEFLTATLLRNETAVNRVLGNYFEYQLDCLLADYNTQAQPRFRIWSSPPPQYSSTLAFELVASSFGIKLQKDYHQLYAFVSERARLIEEEQQKLELIARQKIPNPPLPPCKPLHSSSHQKLNHLTKDRPLQQKNVPANPFIIQLKGQLSDLKTAPKISSTGSSSLSDDVLSEIKSGKYMLKSAASRVLKERPAADQNDLTQILSRQLSLMRISITGDNLNKK